MATLRIPHVRKALTQFETLRNPDAEEAGRDAED